MDKVNSELPAYPAYRQAGAGRRIPKSALRKANFFMDDTEVFE